MDDGNGFEALANQLSTVVKVQEVATRVLKNKPSPVLLSKCKEILAAETKNLLLLEREIYLSQSGDENWESNYWESFELIGSVLKKLTLIEKEIEEKLEGAPIVNPEEDCELISSYSMEAEQEEEEDESIIPSYLFEEDDDSLNFDLLIPSFLFNEEENSSYQQSKEVISSAVNGEKLGCLKELVFSHSKQIAKSRFSPLSDSSRLLFDRGKYAVLSSFTSETNLEQLILSFGYDSDLWFIKLFARLRGNNTEIHDARNVFVEMSQKNKIMLLIMSRVVAQECSAFTRRYLGSRMTSFTLCGTTTVSCLGVFNWLILMDIYREKPIFLSITSWRYLSELSSLCLLVHVYVNDVEVGNGIMLLVTMYEKDNILLVRILQMRSEEFSILQPWYGLCEEITVHSLGLLIITKIHLGRVACTYEFIMFNIIIILPYEFLYMQLWGIPHLVPWFHKAQGNCSVQISISWPAIIRHVSSQILLVVSSTGEFSHETLILLLSFGYHSDFLGIQLVVPLYVHDVIFVVERELTAKMASRYVSLGQLAEAIVGRFSSGDAAILIAIQSDFYTSTLSDYYPCYPAIWTGASHLNEVLIFTHMMRRFAEILKNLNFNSWLAVKSYTHSHLLGGTVTMEDLSYISANTVSANLLQGFNSGAVEHGFSTKLEFFAMLAVPQVLLTVMSILNVLNWFEYLRWKFKLVPPDLWSMEKGTATMGYRCLLFDGGNYFTTDNSRQLKTTIPAKIETTLQNVLHEGILLYHYNGIMGSQFRLMAVHSPTELLLLVSLRRYKMYIRMLFDQGKRYVPGLLESYLVSLGGHQFNCVQNGMKVNHGLVCKQGYRSKSLSQALIGLMLVKSTMRRRDYVFFEESAVGDCSKLFVDFSRQRDMSKLLVRNLRDNIRFPSLNEVLIVCHWFYTGKIRSIRQRVRLFRASDIPAGPSSTVCSRNECCSGSTEFLVVEIKAMLVEINGGVCFYGYLKWKFRLFQPGLWIVRSVTVKVHFSVLGFYKKWTFYSKSLGVVTVYIAVVWNNGDDNTRSKGFPTTSIALTCERLKEGTGAHGSDTSSSIKLLSLCYACLISWCCCQHWSRVYPPPRGYIQLEFLPGIRFVHRSAPTLPLSEVANSIFLVVLNCVLKVQTEFFKHLEVYSKVMAMSVIPCQICETTKLRGQLQHFLAYAVESVAASGVSIGTYLTGNCENKGTVYLGKMNSQESTVLVHLKRIVSTLRLSGPPGGQWGVGPVIQVFVGSCHVPIMVREARSPE